MPVYYSVIEDKKIYDLTEVYEDGNGSGHNSLMAGNNHKNIAIDRRFYERVTMDNDIHNLKDVAEYTSSSSKLNEEIIKRATEIAEKIVREIMPGIAERIVKEEIEKIKRMSNKGLNRNS